MYKIMGIITNSNGDMVVHSINSNTDPFIRATNMGFKHGWIERVSTGELIALIDDSGNIQEV